MPKDSGELHSRLGQIKRQAGKVPGPGAYVSHKDWKLNRGFVWGKTPRDKGSRMNKVPAPGHYELSLALTRPRSVGGNLPKGTKRSFLDNAVEKSAKNPAPDKYQPQHMRPHVPGISMSHGKKASETRSKNKDQGVPAPDKYHPNYNLTERRAPCFGASKESGNSFVDRATKLKDKLPGPGHYEAANLEKTTRGAKWVQINQLPRGPLMGRY